jgi:[acyl-carrier-protein] S-malonyltransferase
MHSNISLALLFPGQGAHFVGMARCLYDTFPQVRTVFDYANEQLSFDLKVICFEGPESILTQTIHCQPALFVHGYAIYELLKSEQALKYLTTVLGLSLGELTALCVAGVFDFETGLQIVEKRAELMQGACESYGGSMISLIGGSMDAIENLCQQHSIDIANLNCPGQTVVSGATENITAAIETARTMNFAKVIPLKVAGAYHSRLMNEASLEFQAFLEPLHFRAPKLKVLTNTTGDFITDPIVIKNALSKQVCSSVQWHRCVETAIQSGVTQCLECGPGNVLAGLGKRIHKEIPIHGAGTAEAINQLLNLSTSLT